MRAHHPSLVITTMETKFSQEPVSAEKETTDVPDPKENLKEKENSKKFKKFCFKAVKLILITTIVVCVICLTLPSPVSWGLMAGAFFIAIL